MLAFNVGVSACIRMLWSFSRDGGAPLYGVWSALNPCTGTPLNATWAMSALAFLIGLPMLLSNAAFIATGALSSVGLYVSCKHISCFNLAHYIHTKFCIFGLQRTGCGKGDCHC